MRIFKALFGGIFAIFGILFGGLWDTVIGAFKSPETPEEQPVQTVASSPPEADSGVSTAPPQVAPPVESSSANGAPVAAPTAASPFSPDQMRIPQPRRRPGKSMAMFKDMARDLPSTRST